MLRQNIYINNQLDTEALDVATVKLAIFWQKQLSFNFFVVASTRNNSATTRQDRQSPNADAGLNLSLAGRKSR